MILGKVIFGGIFGGIAGIHFLHLKLNEESVCDLLDFRRVRDYDTDETNLPPIINSKGRSH